MPVDPNLALQLRAGVQAAYPDLYTPEALAALDALAGFDGDRRALMAARIQRRADRTRAGQRIAFLDPDTAIGHTGLTVRQARAGEFSGADIPADLRRQWIQGTGPGARPRAAWRPACATWPTPSSRAPTAGCSTARTPWAR